MLFPTYGKIVLGPNPHAEAHPYHLSWYVESDHVLIEGEVGLGGYYSRRVSHTLDVEEFARDFPTNVEVHAHGMYLAKLARERGWDAAFEAR